MDRLSQVHAEEETMSTYQVIMVDGDNVAFDGLQRALYNDKAFGRVHLTWDLEPTWERLQGFDSVSLLLNVGAIGEKQTARFIETIRRRGSRLPILVFGWDPCEESIVRMIEAGATAYVRGRSSPAELAKALRAMLAGEVDICPDVAGRMMKRIAELAGYRLPGWHANGDGGQAARLTDRQSEVLQLLRQGMSNAEIAHELVIEVGTVKNHVHNLLKKLGASDRHEAASLQPALVDGGWQLQH
jgi:DNA-binding NarL/FixJ family response regulator